MVTGIRIYYEGDRSLREAFGEFFKQLRDQCRSRKLTWDIIACGPRNVAYKEFRNSIGDHPTAFNVLLVDSEAEVGETPWEHLRRREGDEWIKPEGVADSNCHLMVQAMEAWFLADVPNLKSYYRDGFKANALPAARNGDVERIAKDALVPALNKAVAGTRKKRYHKTQHAPALLQRLSPSRVRKASRHCDRIFTELEAAISPAAETPAPSTPEPVGDADQDATDQS